MRRKMLGRREFVRGGAVGVAGAGLGGGLTARPALAHPSDARGKQVVSRGPLAPGSFISPAVRYGHLVFVSGVGGYHPETGIIPPEGGVELQTRNSLEGVKWRLEAAGTSLENVLKCTVFIRDWKDYDAVNRVYRTYFPKDPPARTIAALPPGSPSMVEIDCIAFVP